MNVSVLAPGAAMLTCQADGEPLPDIVWIRMSTNGSMTTEFNESAGNNMINEAVDGLNKTSFLTIQPTSALDTADYRCRVQNEVDFVRSDTARVTIYGKPELITFSDQDLLLMTCVIHFSQFLPPYPPRKMAPHSL